MFKFYNWSKQEEAGDDGAQSGGGVTIDYDALAAAMIKAQGGKEEKKEANLSDQISDDEKKKAENDKIRAEIEDRAKFNYEFDGFVGSSVLFADKDADYFKGYVNGIEDPAKKTNALKALAAKTAFSDEALRDLLLPEDKEFISSIVDKNETTIDGNRAWRLLRQAEQVHNRLHEHNKTSGISNGGIPTPEYDAYLNRCMAPLKAGFQY